MIKFNYLGGWVGDFGRSNTVGLNALAEEMPVSSSMKQKTLGGLLCFCLLPPRSLSVLVVDIVVGHISQNNEIPTNVRLHVHDLPISKCTRADNHRSCQVIRKTTKIATSVQLKMPLIHSCIIDSSYFKGKSFVHITYLNKSQSSLEKNKKKRYTPLIQWWFS